MKTRELTKLETYKIGFGIILVGVCAGIASFFFHRMFHFLAKFTILDHAITLVPILISLGFLLISFSLTKFIFADTGGSGIPHVKLSLVALKGKMDKRMPLGKYITSLFSLSSGLCLGKEGPLVTISASLAHLLATMLKLSREGTKLIVIAGASSGLSAAFNTPISAVVFTVEEILGELNSRYIGAIIISSVLASTVAFKILGVEPVFGQLSYVHENSWHLIYYGLLGIFMSIFGHFWKVLILSAKDFRSRFCGRHDVIYLVMVFTIIVLAGMFDVRYIGDGHFIITKIFSGVEFGGWQALILLFAAKFVLSALSYSTGISGGIFMPVLTVGALAGVLFGETLVMMGVTDVQVGAFALIGMTSCLVATIRVPFTAFVMLFEMTRDYDMILPLMVSSATAYLFAQVMHDESIYESVSEYEGVHLPTEKDKETLSEMAVQACMITDVKKVDVNDSVEEWKERVKDFPISGYPVVERDHIIGIISKEEILAIEEGQTIKEACRKDIISIYPDQSLLVAIEKLKRFKIGRLPVLSRFNKKKIVGIITMEDIINYFSETQSESQD